MDTVTIFVGNLPWSTTNEELYVVMSRAGTITSCEIQRHEHSNRSKGWALVTYEAHSMALDAVNLLDGVEINERKIHVRLDRSAVESVKGYVVFLGNIPWSFTDKNVMDIFQQWVPYDGHVMRNMAGRSRGFALVKFVDGRQALEAIREINGKDLDGRVVECRMNRENVSRSYGNSERNSVTVRDISDSIDETILRAHFSGCGEISSVKLIRQDDKCKAVIEFANRKQCVAATGLHGTLIMGCAIDVKANRK